MGNSLGGSKRTVKIMKINGETIKLKTPVQAGEVVKDYPGYVLLESEAVKHFGIRAKPLEAQQGLEPKRLYFLVELPKLEEDKCPPRRVRSGIHMSAKDRLESLKLARRSISDLSLMKQTSVMFEDGSDRSSSPGDQGNGGSVRLKMRLPKAEVARLMQESRDEAEAAQKIMDLCLANKGKESQNIGQQRQVRLKSGHERPSQGFKKRVSFMPVNEGEIQMAGGPGIESW
uniref:Plastid movement impaired 2 n=1 Tax=Kalanchoe fedtschenkoi TaxID=63787 RepID=A0A7N0TL28_KALFE